MIHPSLDQQFRLLELDTQATERDVRRAYAVKLKQIDLETDPGAFQALQEAYQALMDWARNGPGAFDASPPSTPAPAPAAESDPIPAHEADPDPVPPPESSAPPDPIPRRAPVEPTAELRAAEKLFDEVMSQLAKISPGRNASRDARRVMVRAMHEPALVHLEAREYFEWCAVQRLTQGWQPGNEWLFETAIDAFGWKESQKNLSRFDGRGLFIEAALHEWEFFNHQQQQEREEQLELLEELRSDKERDLDWLLYRRDRLDMMGARFPALIEMLGDPERFVGWLNTIAQTPKWRRLTVTAAAIQKTVIVETEEEAEERQQIQSVWGWGLFIFFLVMIAYNVLIEPRIHAKRAAEAAHTPYVAMPDTADIEAQFSGSASIGGCNDAYNLGRRARDENLEYRLGPRYHAYVEKCRTAGYSVGR